ncbi:MAG: SAM-dependent methyltransferase [Marinilabiliales bacterium]|nr:MAG: SAM-dependent methyltransferase [Marinilabiliales bacterium]
MKTFVKKILSDSISRKVKKIYLFARGIAYYGTNYHCNICGKSFRKFLPGGFDLPIIKEMDIIGAGRRNHICPNCQSTDRDRLIKSFFDINQELLSDNKTVLHIAPEPSLYNFLKKYKNIKYIPAAKYHEGIYYPKEMTLVDLTSMQFANNEFDIIICNHVLEHIEDHKTALKEIYRVLVKKGIAILQVPYSLKLKNTHENPEIKSEKDREKYFGQFDHVRLYGSDYTDILKSAGFKLNEFIAEDNISPNKIEKMKLFANETLFVVNK